MLAKRLVSAQVRRECWSCSTFPLAPNLLLSHSFPQCSSLRAHFINPLSTWLPATLLCRTLSPPLWSGARKSIELLIAVSSSSSSSSVAQLLTQEIDVPELALAGRTGTTQDIRQPGPRGRLASALTPRSGWAQLSWLAAFTSKATTLSSPSARETEVPFSTAARSRNTEFFYSFDRPCISPEKAGAYL